MKLTEELAVRLAAVVPPGVEVTARAADATWADHIRIAAGQGSGCRIVEHQPWHQPEPDWFACDVLSALQDEIIEFATHTGWPPADPANPTAPQRSAELPQPGAAIENDHLVCWYGDRHAPALAIPPSASSDAITEVWANVGGGRSMSRSSPFA